MDRQSPAQTDGRWVSATKAATVAGTFAGLGDSSTRLFWSYAAAFGAAWGVLEITVGSFLHSLRLPFSGFVLAAMGVVLLAAQREIRPVVGLSLATGLVAAACKSISPGGIILGPMMGISAEALLVEVVLSAAPRGWWGSAAAGALGVQLPAVQKVLTQVIFYGGGVIDLYLSVFRQGLSLVGWTGHGLAVLIVAAVALGLLGVVAGIAGHRLGRGARARLGGLARCP